MLQQFYKETLQSQYIKYLLNNNYIPTVPFTSNILHVTKGNTYIHNGYFVTAKISDAVAAINEDIEDSKKPESSNPNIYHKYFIKHEPYIFGNYYKGLTTKYKSNTKGYDSTTHYYLGEYLRAYRAYYNIDLMPFYNCFSNEYVDYLSLENDENGKVRLSQHQNKQYKIISVPIKFCQKYSIAIQCPHTVKMLPVFIGNKGLLEDLTSKLHKLEYQGKQIPNIDFKSPYIYESPHINSVYDKEQANLQAYDKYLKLLIQIPADVKTSIVVLEGEYSNSKTFSKKIINTSKEDVEDLWKQYYDTKIPSDNNGINIPDNSQLVCEDITRQKLYLNVENSIAYIDNDDEQSFKFILNLNANNYPDTLKNLMPVGIDKDLFIKSKLDYNIFIEGGVSQYALDLSPLCVNNGVGNNYDEKQDKYLIYTQNESSGGYYPLTAQLKISSEKIDDKASIIAWTQANSDPNIDSKIRAIVSYKDDYGWISFYLYEFAFYLKEEYFKSEGDAFVRLNFSENLVQNCSYSNNQIKIVLKDSPNSYIKLSSDMAPESQDAWELKSEISLGEGKFNSYLNKYLLSNLSLLKFNDGISYGFCGRLIEYLTNAVITKEESISNNIKRVQNSLGVAPNGIWDDNLRVNTFKKILDKKKGLNQIVPYDINGFIDKDSENILTIENEISSF